MNLVVTILLTFAFATTVVFGLQSSAIKPSKVNVDSNRRRAFQFIVSGVAVAFVGNANALDMDAFVNAELDSDTKNCNPKTDSKCIPPLSKDEALCKYGQSGNARGEACKRVREAGGEVTKPAEGRSLGGAYAI